MSDSKQLKEDSTSSRPGMWSGTMALVNVPRSRTPGASSDHTKGEAATDTVDQRGPDTARQKCQSVPAERTETGGKGRRDNFFPLPGEVRNTIYALVYNEDVLPYEVDILQINRKLLPDSSLSSVSSQINQETYLYEGDVIEKFLNRHRFFTHFNFEDLRKRCTENRLLLKFIHRDLQHPAIALLRELEIIVLMPYPDSRPGKDANLRIMTLDKPDEDGQIIIFAATCQRRDDNDDGQDDPKDLLKVLGELENLAQAHASTQEPELTAKFHGCTYLDVRSCVRYLHMLLRSDGNRLLHTLADLVRNDGDEMAVSSIEIPHDPTESSPTGFSEMNPTAVPMSYPEAPPKEKHFGEHYATETRLPDCAPSIQEEAAKSKTSKGRQPLNFKRRGR
ncbi:hypothetical protein HII31_05791 [Pseudocercospora fuligena]|uniref:Uncharacterized protein n=1 Tax=Pseudocercospora fuligena TaxID=685502 RepID=A0A8H6RLL9_9PEZI|nr:hypothetical protein HII31_05791 [Pseudocercospora fuligena]